MAVTSAESPVNTQSAYDQWSSTYERDRNLTRDLDHAVTRATLAQLRPAAVLEIGCGTGKNTALLAQFGVPVTAVDFSTGMLDEAKKKVVSDHVTFLSADLTQSWPCASQSVDLIVCNLVLEHISNLDFIFAEAARCLVLGGVFFVCELHPFRQYLGAQARFEQAGSPTEITAFLHHLSDFTDAARAQGFVLERFQEWWHVDDQGKPPRLASFLFRQAAPNTRVVQKEGLTMALDRSFVELNRASTKRIRDLAAGLTDQELQHPVGEHWTVAIALAHLAWWDRRVMYVLDMTERNGELFVPEIDIFVNDLSLPLWAAIPPREAARIAIETAETLDKRLESYPEALLELIHTYNRRWVVRALHRSEHLDEVDAALRG